MKFISWLLLLTIGFFPLAGEEPLALWLTWQHAPESTMVIHWITSDKDPVDTLLVRPKNTQEWFSVEGGHSLLPQGEPRFIHTLELVDLAENQLYEFSHNNTLYTFKTAPKDLSTPIVFIEGGDIYHDEIEVVEKMNRLAVAYDPLFAICGGDLAYSASRLTLVHEKTERWMTWLSSWGKTMRAQDGRLIPMVPAIGNHEVLGTGLRKPAYAAMFYHLFALTEDKGYRALNFGNWMSLLLLDSNHTHAVSGEQTKFVEESLNKSMESLFKFAVYHVPAYPSRSKISHATSKEIRKNWSPLFEKHSLTAAFEHHEHLYKRTHLMRAEKIDPTGVLYVGDGGWGTKKTRKPNNNYYLAKTASIRHLFAVTLEKGIDKPKATFEAFDENGEVFDKFTR